MVFGINEGVIDIYTDKPAYHESETIRGNVVLGLPSRKKCRSVTVSLFAYSVVKKGKVIYSRKISLAENALLEPGQHEYPFEAKLPTDSDMPVGEAYPYEWYLEAKLDAPLSFDVKKTQKVLIS